MTKSRSSIALTWIIRILLVIIAFCVFTMILLRMVSGTSDVHRAGLEQAFSDFLKADVKIGAIYQFNVVPQLSVKVGDIHGVSRDTKNEFKADRIDFSFGFMDLLKNTHRIENFQIENFRFARDSALDLHIDHAGINPELPATLTARGGLSKRDFDLSIPLIKEVASRASYGFDTEKGITGHFGSLDIKGLPVPAGQKGGLFSNIGLLSGGEVVAKGHAEPDKASILKFVFDCAGLKKPSATASADLQALKSFELVEFSKACD